MTITYVDYIVQDKNQNLFYFQFIVKIEKVKQITNATNFTFYLFILRDLDGTLGKLRSIGISNTLSRPKWS